MSKKITSPKNFGPFTTGRMYGEGYVILDTRTDSVTVYSTKEAMQRELQRRLYNFRNEAAAKLR